MEGIRESIAEAEKRIKRLGERSQEITGIVNLINTIAERTHVLALNASMQAAAAGDAGRGFAVVAEEVQRLAESSRQATQQIAQLVNNIQIETSDTINTVNKTISQVVLGIGDRRAAPVTQMRETQQSTASLVELVKRITSSAQVQMKITTELRNRVHQIGASTEKTAAEILLQSEATADLSKSADRLVESVRVFKLPTTAARPNGRHGTHRCEDRISSPRWPTSSRVSRPSSRSVRRRHHRTMPARARTPMIPM